MDRTARCLRTVDIEGGSCVDNTVNSTVVLSVRHTTWSANKRATHNVVGEQACDTQRGRRTSVRHNRVDIEKRAVGNNGRAIQWRNVARENYVKGMCVSGDLYALRSVYL